MSEGTKLPNIGGKNNIAAAQTSAPRTPADEQEPTPQELASAPEVAPVAQTKAQLTAASIISALSPAEERLKAIEAETAEIALKTARLKLEAEELNVLDLRERVDDRKLKREAVTQNARTKGQAIEDVASQDRKHQAHCNHRKGGDGAAGVVGGQGDDSQYAVIKHKFANNDFWIRCLRCGKTWKPPIRKRYANEADYNTAKVAYEAALGFQTRNKPSGGVVFNYSDGGEHYRENTENATLR